MNFPVLAITLDLDDTLWPFAPIGARIDQVLHDWMLEHSPATASMYPVAAMRELRERSFRDNPQLHYDLSALRRLTLAEALEKSGASMDLLDPPTKRSTPRATRSSSIPMHWPHCAASPRACRWQQ